jgi:GNAT superfamily N-acetyltransferase
VVETLAEAIERAALRAWPALREEHRGGWLLRASDGYTKRANSATLLDAADAADAIDDCEAWFRDARIGPVFRLLSFTTPPALDDHLGSRGYRRLDPTLVLYRPLDDIASPSGEQMHSVGLNDWLTAYCRLHGAPLERHAVHRRILQSIEPPCLFATLLAGDDVVACGVGVLDGGVVGLFDLVTAPERRNQGLGRQLVAAMLGWARSRGAVGAYLQVVADNRPARGLYDKLGFTALYHYWYRAAPARM